MKTLWPTATTALRRALLPGAMCALLAGATEAPAATLVVDRDRAQCANARFTSIQAAVDAARRNDQVRVCPDLYPERVVIDKPLTLMGEIGAVEAVDCFGATASQPGARDRARQAILDPPGDGFAIALKLTADRVTVAGLVIEGASVGIDASDRFSGYRIHHNLIQHNTLFGIDFGSSGHRLSRVHHNCIRNTQGRIVNGFQWGWGLVSELDDDTLWPLPPVGNDRGAYARDLRNARIDHNDSTGNSIGFEAGGPGKRIDVRLDHNRSRLDRVGGIALQNSRASAIVANEITDTRGGHNWLGAIWLGFANQDLKIVGNRITGGGATGILFYAPPFRDKFDEPSKRVTVIGNQVRAAAVGIFTDDERRLGRPVALEDSAIAANTVSGNQAAGIQVLSGLNTVISSNTVTANFSSGIFLGARNSGSHVTANQSNNNGRNGIAAALGSTGHLIEHNAMHGNGTRPDVTPLGVDARDDNELLNDWIDNDCLTDSPLGAICTTG